jgi:hypothetical protein
MILCIAEIFVPGFQDVNFVWTHLDTSAASPAIQVTMDYKLRNLIAIAGRRRLDGPRRLFLRNKRPQRIFG